MSAYTAARSKVNCIDPLLILPPLFAGVQHYDGDETSLYYYYGHYNDYLQRDGHRNQAREIHQDRYREEALSHT